MIKTVAKTIVLFTMFVVANGIDGAISPISATELALQQMNNAVDSSMLIQMYLFFNNYKWLVALMIAIVTYANEIEAIVLKGKK